MFGKFMNKKFFHPGSYPNVKLRWIHEQRDAAKKKSEEEKQATYQKEQESYQSRMLSAKSTEEKMKLDLNFLYDLPPGMKNDDKEAEEKENKEQEVKFEWQKHAPRSKYINDLGLECADQPFGVCVRNIRCFKCRAWGHQNTDRECPLYFTNVNSEAQGNTEGKSNLMLSDPLLLVGIMKEQHGLTLKKSVIGKEIDPMAENQQLIGSDIDDDELGKDDLMFVESLTSKQKRKLLKRLNKLEKNEQKQTKKKEKRKLYKERSKDGIKSCKLSGSEDDKSEDDYRNYKKRKCKNEENVADYSKSSKKHKKLYSENKNKEFDFNVNVMLISERGGKSSRYDKCYKNGKSSGSDDNSYYKKDDFYTVNNKHLKICNSKERNHSVRSYGYNDRNYIKSHEYKDYKRRETINEDSSYGYNDRNYLKSHEYKDYKWRETINEDTSECNGYCNESDNDNKSVIRRRLKSKSYNEIDEKLYQIRNGIINKSEKHDKK